MAFVVKMLIMALLIGLALLVGMYFWLRHYTEHGVEVTVPDICGMYVEEAEIMLSTAGLHVQVIDSTYSNKVALGTVVEQNPPANAKVKHGRNVYVIANAKSYRQIPVPDLHDMSYRQAEAMLKALGLEVANVVYEPSEYKGLVLDVRLKGVSLGAGARLQEGTAVTLVVGKGSGTETVYVPDVTDKTLTEARNVLLQSGLIVGAANYDTPEAADDSLTQVYRQEPHSGIWVTEGSHVDLFLSQDPEKAKTDRQTEDEEDFF
ncbi:MAG: PASTA domain-containing protein [Paludibacter sp.]|nr:PASTA domain-containing protein [Bacteroidales bacterium]MCM1068621.1 PASTA domain-containing protein [Prevotella sp.]MCM1353285.1 PASTA domain-containing protein [Bacteroides sp.]MCM1442307.1 PASTA domain-containing protein [Muribaculum sp.]MCM1481126.1 PASTA domain-containing protein [Paludibacter sp.]